MIKTETKKFIDCPCQYLQQKIRDEASGQNKLSKKSTLLKNVLFIGITPS